MSLLFRRFPMIN